MKFLQDKTALVVTSIAAPNKILRMLAEGATLHGMTFLLIGDVPSPADFSLQGCRFLSLESQRQTGFLTAELCPLRHYARKNVGYLLAMREGASRILETDDDNLPRPEFWLHRPRRLAVPSIRSAGWLNVYRYFTDDLIWPRGFPLEAIQRDTLPPVPLAGDVDCPVQQGLADGSPDVDAIWRLVKPQSISFQPQVSIAAGPGSWCPFNSQNTAWWADAFPLLYLPSTCTFRMTDIWRSFVAQRICWENEWHILFHEATVLQERNEHDLLRDFSDEIPGYLNNGRISEALSALPLRPGRDRLADNLLQCYEALIRMSLLEKKEMKLLEAWLRDLAALT